MAAGSGSDVTAVIIGGSTTAPLQQSASSLVVVVPNIQPGNSGRTVDVTVQSTSFGSATRTGFYTYNAVPVITSLVPTHGPATGSTTVTIKYVTPCAFSV
jgi:hypothetical protein